MKPKNSPLNFHVLQCGDMHVLKRSVFSYLIVRRKLNKTLNYILITHHASLNLTTFYTTDPMLSSFVLQNIIVVQNMNSISSPK